MARDHWYVIEKDEQTEVLDGDKKVVQAFSVSENLPRALELLREFNKIKDTQGNALCTHFLYRGISLWSFHQEVIFWKYFRYFAKYEMIYRFFSTIIDKPSVIHVDETSAELRTILEIILQFRVARPYQNTITKKLKKLSLKLCALCVSILAISKMMIKKNIPIIYSPDNYSNVGCDFRIYPLYKYMWGKKKDYVEIFHTNWGENFLKNLFKRKKVALYLESLVWGSLALPTSMPQADFKEVPSHVGLFYSSVLSQLGRMMGKSFQLLPRLEKILSWTSIPTIVALDDVRYTNELIMACRENNIKIYGLQHGQFTKYHVGWMNYDLPLDRSVTFDTLFVWNEFWKNMLLRYSSQYTSQNVEIGGWLRKLPDFVVQKKIASESSLSFLIPYEISLSKNVLKKYIRKFLDLGCTIYFKVRPDLSQEDQKQTYGFLSSDNVIIVKQIDAEVLGKIDAVVGVYSTFLSEMIYYEKPIIQIDCSFDLGHYLKDEHLATQLSPDFTRQHLQDIIENFHSVKAVVWPPSKDINTLFAELIP